MAFALHFLGIHEMHLLVVDVGCVTGGAAAEVRRQVDHGGGEVGAPEVEHFLARARDDRDGNLQEVG